MAMAKTDILWRNVDGTAAIWLMNGTTFIGGGALPNIGPSTLWAVAGTGDFNGDGKSDILWQNAEVRRDLVHERQHVYRRRHSRAAPS